MALESFARSSLAQFITIYAEIVEGTDSLAPQELECQMWAAIKGGPKPNKLPWPVIKKVKIQLPYLPDFINYTGCQAIKKADGLYVPCGGKCDGLLCQSCEKSEAKFGMLADRGEPGTYTDPSEKREIRYGTWLAKHEKSIEEVHGVLEEAGFSLKIPASYLTVNSKRVATRRPGRPGNAKVHTSDTDSGDEDKKFPSQSEALAEAARIMEEFGSDEEGEVVLRKTISHDEESKVKTTKPKVEKEKVDKPKKEKKREGGVKEVEVRIRK